MKSTVLLVDDDRDHLAVLKAIIEGLTRDHPVEVVSFTSAREALAWCREGGADVCLVDYMMPGMNGLDFISALRSLPNFSHLPVVMFTGFPAKHIRQHALDCGATDLWTKPVDAGEIRVRLRQILDRTPSNPPGALSAASPA